MVTFNQIISIMKKLLFIVSLAAFPLTATAQTLLDENFQSGSIPATWTVQQTNALETWHVEDPLLGTDLKATVNYDATPAAQDEMLITPSLDLTGASSYTLKAQIGLSYYWSVTPENNYDVFIKVSIDNGTTWTQVWSENDLGVFTNWVMNPVSVNLNSYAGNPNVKIAFQYVGNDGAALYLDNVSVSVPPSTPPNCATQVAPANAATGVNYTAPIALSWTAPSAGSQVDSYDVFLGTSANPTTLLGNVNGLTINATGLMASTTYYWKVVSKNAAGSATGCSEFMFTTSANPFAPYCGPLPFSSSVEPITLVNFAGINNTTSATLGGAGHENFTTITGTVAQGSSYPITLKGNTDGPFTNRFVVFIDWNQNGVLNDAGEIYQIAQTIVGSTGVDAIQATETLVVPAGATLGNTRMRVKKLFGTTNAADPCLGASFGQAEDYTLNVTSLGVSNVNKSQVKVYPNPVVDVLNIDADSKVSNVQVFDLSGKAVSSFDLNQVRNQVNLSKLAPGVYVVNIQTEKGIQSVKIVKK